MSHSIIQWIFSKGTKTLSEPIWGEKSKLFNVQLKLDEAKLLENGGIHRRVAE